jgi:hypothetical protein
MSCMRKWRNIVLLGTRNQDVTQQDLSQIVTQGRMCTSMIASCVSQGPEKISAAQGREVLRYIIKTNKILHNYRYAM